MFAINNLLALGGVAGEFDRRLDRLRAGVAEEHLGQVGRAGGEDFLGQQARQQGHVHLHHVRQFGIQHVFQGLHDGRVVAA